jgi:hypothetical protein
VQSITFYVTIKLKIKHTTRSKGKIKIDRKSQNCHRRNRSCFFLRSTWVHPCFKWGSRYSIFSFICMLCASLFVLLYFCLDIHYNYPRSLWDISYNLTLHSMLSSPYIYVYIYIRLKIKPNSVRIIFLSCQYFVLPSTGFELTPLIHCSTIRLALRPLDHIAYIYKQQIFFDIMPTKAKYINI